MTDAWYVRREIDSALKDHPEGTMLRLKIIGDAGETKHLSVSADEVRAIRDLLTTDHEHTADCMDRWAELRRDIMTPATVAANHRLHMGPAWNDERCPCGASHTRAEHNYDPDND